jgi:hypothetical protein
MNTNKTRPDRKGLHSFYGGLLLGLFLLALLIALASKMQSESHRAIEQKAAEIIFPHLPADDGAKRIVFIGTENLRDHLRPAEFSTNKPITLIYNGNETFWLPILSIKPDIVILEEGTLPRPDPDMAASLRFGLTHSLSSARAVQSWQSMQDNTNEELCIAADSYDQTRIRIISKSDDPTLAKILRAGIYVATIELPASTDECSDEERGAAGREAYGAWLLQILR